MEVLKIRTLKGRIITLTVKRKTDSHYFGVDKFGHDLIVSVEEIDSLFTVHKGVEDE